MGLPAEAIVMAEQLTESGPPETSNGRAWRCKYYLNRERVWTAASSTHASDPGIPDRLLLPYQRVGPAAAAARGA